MKQQSVINEKLKIAGREIEVIIRHSVKAKHMQLQINNSGILNIVVPRGRRLSEAREFLNSKIKWLTGNIHLIDRRRETKYYIFGEAVTVEHSTDMFIKNHLIKYDINDKKLLIKSPLNSREETYPLFEQYLIKRANRYLTERARALAKSYQFFPSKIVIRNQKTRWGSCSSSGTISLNYNLVKFRPEVIDYLIIHELCHLRQMNHSSKFWKEVERYVPNFRELRQELKSAKFH